MSEITETSSFKAGFAFARKIPDPAFRKWLKDLGWKSGNHIYPAGPDTTIGDLIRRIAIHGDCGMTGPSFIAMADPEAEHGFRLLYVATTAPKESGS